MKAETRELDTQHQPEASARTSVGWFPHPSHILCETAADFLSEAQLDRDGGLVRNVALLGMESRNGYRYRADAMREATPLYEGRPVFVDHPPLNRGGFPIGPIGPISPIERKLRDYAGKVLNPRFENERIRGDLRLLGPNAGWLMSLIESAPEDIGMSHVVAARRSRKGDEVEKIERVVSVDIVAFPATTRSFVEAAVGQVSNLSSTNGAPAPDIRRLVEASQLPPAVRSNSLYELLRESHDPQRVIAFLERYLRAAFAETPRSQERNGHEPNSAAAQRYRQQLLFAVRGE